MQLIIPNAAFTSGCTLCVCGSSSCDGGITWTQSLHYRHHHDPLGDHFLSADTSISRMPPVWIILSKRYRPVGRGADSPHWSAAPPTAVSCWSTPNSPQSAFQLGKGVWTRSWAVSHRRAAPARLPARDMVRVRGGHLGSFLESLQEWFHTVNWNG